MTVLAAVGDFLSWRTQFTGFMIMHQLQSMLDGSLPLPPSLVPSSYGMTNPNSGYGYRLRVGQLVRAWLFATISKETLSEVCDISHSLHVWQHLESRFNMASLACALDLKRMLTNLSLGLNQTVDSYLRSIKTIADSLVTIQSPLFDLELI